MSPPPFPPKPAVTNPMERAFLNAAITFGLFRTSRCRDDVTRLAQGFDLTRENLARSRDHFLPP
mgnify:CR=1 FL=1